MKITATIELKQPSDFNFIKFEYNKTFSEIVSIILC